MNEYPSPFYAQLEPSSNFKLEYPFVDDVGAQDSLGRWFYTQLKSGL